MSTTRRLIAVFSLLLAAQLPALASPDLAACRHANGNAIEPKVCEKLREADAREKAAAVDQAARQAKHREQAAAARAEEAEAEAKRSAAVAAAGERSFTEAAAREARARQAQAEQERAEAEDEARLQVLQRQCGQDFQRPRVGMTLARARQCVGDLQLFGQNGAVAHYRAGPLMLSVEGGVITRWVVL